MSSFSTGYNNVAKVNTNQLQYIHCESEKNCRRCHSTLQVMLKLLLIKWQGRKLFLYHDKYLVENLLVHCSYCADAIMPVIVDGCRGPAVEWYDALIAHFRHSRSVRLWFVQNILFAQPSRLSEYLLESPSSEARISQSR